VTDTHDGLVVVDKPSGWTSHDVVARVRRLAGIRRVGHAGTLDPMATGVLVVGVGRATRLLGHLALTDKEYVATIRIGETTTTDDADGQVITRAGAADVGDNEIASAMAGLTGELDQVPSSVSAIRVEGVRAYKRVRSGEDVVLEPRRIRVDAFELMGRRGVDLDVRVACSTGTYVRALARDLGAALGVGAHLTSLRRTRVGPFVIAQARSLEALEAELVIVPLADAVATAFPRYDVDDETARLVSYGQRVDVDGPEGVVGVFDPAGDVVALVETGEARARPVVVFRPAG